MSIVTKKGDDGRTFLLTGEEVNKDALRIEAFGTVDELNSFLGVARALIDPLEGEAFQTLSREVQELQVELFQLGAELACAAGSPAIMVEPVDADRVAAIEQRIAALEASVKLPPSFVIPGGTRASAMMDVARTVARRLERRVVALAHAGEYANAHGLIYLNRLSDYLFMLARAIEKHAGVLEMVEGRT
jgi:cob(I)alamin adenosyltransferase